MDLKWYKITTEMGNDAFLKGFKIRCLKTMSKDM